MNERTPKKIRNTKLEVPLPTGGSITNLLAKIKRQMTARDSIRRSRPLKTLISKKSINSTLNTFHPKSSQMSFLKEHFRNLPARIVDKSDGVKRLKKSAQISRSNVRGLRKENISTQKSRSKMTSPIRQRIRKKSPDKVKSQVTSLLEENNIEKVSKQLNPPSQPEKIDLSVYKKIVPKPVCQKRVKTGMYLRESSNRTPMQLKNRTLGSPLRSLNRTRIVN